MSGNWILGFGSDGALRLDFRVCWPCIGELDFRVWLGWGFEVGFRGLWVGLFEEGILGFASVSANLILGFVSGNSILGFEGRD